MPDITFIVVTIQYLGISNQLFYKSTIKSGQFLMQVVLKTEMEIHGNYLGSPTAEEMGPEDFDL